MRMRTSKVLDSVRRERPAGFLRSTSGSFSVFSLFVFLAMILVAGLAIDMMRHENARVRMQGVTDRAVLAATMLGNNNGYATPEQLLQSYFAAADLTAQLGNNYQITNSPWTGLNVTAAPRATMPNQLLNLISIDNFPVTTSASAREAAVSAWLDLVMVIDISGSMGFDGGGRIIALRQAASQLATQLLNDNQDGRISLTLVPYDTSVYPPPAILPYLNNVHGTVGDCPDFRQWTSITDTVNAEMDLRECHTDAWGEIHPYMGNASQAVTAINALQPRDVTSIDLGLRWGAAFFDPTLRPAVDQLITDGSVSNDFDGRPFDWNEPNVVRAVILLTDGENCCGHRYSESQQDANTLAVCSELKDKGVLIYTIAFEASASGQTLMMNCASSPAHYFDPAVGGLMNVFSSIASNVVTQTLRLTQ
ncbi:MAG: VWA domain-containing protein [Rhodobacter sp.]|nr:VWA domain-containing protein [Paracoccaceae bacterium]MCB1411147.1 VWA domain-containing protein [Paracoccaceae bacterium]MCC0080145.1 VWA domain-containing protein [Rhodobacter sp.]